MKQTLLFVWFAIVWVALWGDLSTANVLGGLAVGALVVAATDLSVTTPAGTSRSRPDSDFRSRRAASGNEPHSFRPVAAVRYLLRFLRDLTVASVEVARQVFWPIARLRPAVVLVELRSTDSTVLTLVANTITLTPGTMTLDLDAPTGRLWVHALHVPGGPDGDDLSGVLDSARAYERHARATLGLAPVPAHPGEAS